MLTSFFSVLVISFMVYSNAELIQNKPSKHSLSRIALKQYQENDERYFIEKETGRQMFFHGVNAIVKGFPYVPSTDAFDIDISLVDQDHALLADLGVNVYRLGTMWKGAEPIKDQFNQTYFNQLKVIVEKASSYGIYSLLDMHQDVISEKFCGEGIPDYVAIPTDENFAEPVDSIYTDRAEDGFPTRADCAKHGWASYYNTKATSSVFQNMYNSVDTAGSTLAYWGRFWMKVTEQFNQNSAVLGYELINEPWAGDIFIKPSLLVPSIADKENLQPAYDYLVDTIRQIDNETLVFFAGVTWDDPIPAGFSHAPGSNPTAAENSVFAYHFYLPPQLEIPYYFHVRENDAKRLQTGMMLTEFERPLPNDDYENDTFVTIANIADSHLLSWSMWEYKTFCRETEESLASSSQAAEFGSCKTG
jgi:endoglycosylceramidase